MPCSEPYPETFLCACFCPCREGGRANSMWIFVQLVLVLLGEVQSLPCQSSCMIACPGRKNRVCHSSKCTELTGQRQKFFFSFFFLKARNFFNFHIVRSIKRSPACLMLLWGKMGADGLWGGMFIESDPQFQNSKAFLLVHASERDFLGVKSFIVWQEDLWRIVLLWEGREKK